MPRKKKVKKKKRERLNNLSEGEEFITEFFDDEGIKFKHDVKITNLKGDSSPYRTADFYLPKYEIYLEFFGQWLVSKKHRKRYEKKRKVYEKNKIPCVYIYPENLGTLDFTFYKRLKKVLIENSNLKGVLFRYNLRELIDNYAIIFVLLGVLIFFIENLVIRIILILAFVYLSYKSYKDYFKK